MPAASSGRPRHPLVVRYLASTGAEVSRVQDGNLLDRGAVGDDARKELLNVSLDRTFNVRVPAVSALTTAFPKLPGSSVHQFADTVALSTSSMLRMKDVAVPLPRCSQ